MTRALPLLLAAAFLAGCGGSDTESDPAAAKQEFIVAGDEICAEAQTEAADLRRRAQEIQAQGGTQSEQIEQAAELWDEQVEFAERFRERIGDLDPPPGDEAQIEAMLAALDEGIVIARGIKARLDDGQTVPPELVQSYARTVEQGNALARAYGFQSCGR